MSHAKRHRRLHCGRDGRKFLDIWRRFEATHQVPPDKLADLEKIELREVAFHPVRPDMPSYDQPEELRRMVAQAMGQKEGPEVVANMLTPHVRDIYADLDAATEGADLILTHPLPFVGPIIAQKKGLRWVSSVLAPASFLSVYDPIVPPQWPWLHKLMALSPLVGRAVLRLATHKLDRLMQPVYELRAELGLPRGAQPLLAGQHSPTLVLALFSKVLAQPQRDWPAHTRITGEMVDRVNYRRARSSAWDAQTLLLPSTPTCGRSATSIASTRERSAF